MSAKGTIGLSIWMTWINNDIHVTRNDVITDTCPNFKRGLKLRRFGVKLGMSNYIPQESTKLVVSAFPKLDVIAYPCMP